MLDQIPFFDAIVSTQPNADALRSVETQVLRGLAIVLTQSCDLAVRPDGKCGADYVLFCAVYRYGELFGNPLYRPFDKVEGWESARKGQLTRYHVLNQAAVLGRAAEFLLVDLGRVTTLSTRQTRLFAAAAAQRVRLLPPYREHLSQAFARYFMRVGLPTDVPPFKPAKP